MTTNGQHPPEIDWASMPEWLSVTESAELAGYHPEYIRRLARQAKIKAKKTRDWWIDRDSLQAYMAEMESLGSKKYDPRGLPQVHE